MKYFVIVILCAMFLVLATPAFVSQAPCTPVFGGGIQKDGSEYCLELVQAASTSNAVPTPMSGFHTPNDSLTNQPTTKGGYPVQSPPIINKQPNTGPEMLGIVALLPAAIMGFALRKKTTL